MTWSEAFASYIAKRFPEATQQAAAQSLKIAPSMVHYWCNGSRARDHIRARIERWSGGAVRADLPKTKAA